MDDGEVVLGQAEGQGEDAAEASTIDSAHILRLLRILLQSAHAATDSHELTISVAAERCDGSALQHEVSAVQAGELLWDAAGSAAVAHLLSSYFPDALSQLLAQHLASLSALGEAEESQSRAAAERTALRLVEVALGVQGNLFGAAPSRAAAVAFAVADLPALIFAPPGAAQVTQGGVQGPLRLVSLLKPRLPSLRSWASAPSHAVFEPAGSLRQRGDFVLRPCGTRDNPCSAVRAASWRAVARRRCSAARGDAADEPGSAAAGEEVRG